MDEFRVCMPRRDARFWNHFGQEGRAEEAGEEKEYEVQNGEQQRTTRTICRDDEFVHRGANPRTGIVSPFIFGEGGGEDCRSPDMLRKRTDGGRAKGESWIEDIPQCGLVESGPLSSTAHTFDDGSTYRKRPRKMKNSQIPSHENMRLPEMTNEEALKYRGELRSLCGSDPNTAVAMRRPVFLNSTQWMSASPIPPLTELQHIHRKKVGSGPVQVGGVTNPETIKDVGQDLKQSISKKDDIACKTNVANSIRPGNTSLIVLSDDTSHLTDKEEDPATSRENITEAAVTKTEPLALGQYIPRLRFLQKNLDACLSTSYRRPAHLVAVQPRAVEMKENGRDMCGVSDDGDSSQSWISEQRPQVHRRFGAFSIPTAEFYESEWEDERQYFLSIRSHGNVNTTNAGMRVSRAELNLQNHNTYNGWPLPSFGSTNVKSQSERHCSCRQCMELRTEYLSNSAAKLDKKSFACSTMSQGNSRIPQAKNEHLLDSYPLGNDISRAVSGTRAKNLPLKTANTVPMSIPDTMKLRLEDCSSGWLQSLCPDDNAIEGPCAKPVQREGGDIPCPDFLLGKLVEAGRLIFVALCSSKKIQHILKWLARMLRHAVLTLHQSSPAMKTIGMSNPMISEYIGAMISVLLAILYLLLLLNIVIALGKVVKLMGQTLGLIWVPLRVALLVFKWCVLS